jgi:hypothetical protein
MWPAPLPRAGVWGHVPPWGVRVGCAQAQWGSRAARFFTQSEFGWEEKLRVCRIECKWRISQKTQQRLSGNVLAAPCIWKQDVKTFLGKMVVAGEHFREPFAPHDMHGDAVGEAVCFIGASFVEGYGIKQ